MPSKVCQPADYCNCKLHQDKLNNKINWNKDILKCASCQEEHYLNCIEFNNYDTYEEAFFAINIYCAACEFKRYSRCAN